VDAPPHVQRILDQLEGVEQNGAGWKARCPAHDDQNPSLSVGFGDDGRVLVSCHAGCEFAAIVKASGLAPGDFFAPHATNGRAGPRRRTPRVFEKLADAIEAACPRGHVFIKSWPYKDAQGDSVFHVCRFEPTTTPLDGKKPKKTFRPISRVNGGFVIKDPEGPLPLYRLPELLAAPKDAAVYVTEGEKAANAIAGVGLAATTTAHGSKSPGKTDLSPLAGRHVAILPDYDTAGDRYAAKLASLLLGLTPPAVVRFVRLPGLPEKGDAVEFIASRCSEGKTNEAIRSEVEDLARTAAVVEPMSPSSPPDQVPDGPNRRPRTDTGNAERLADRHRPELRYVHLWKKSLVWDGMRWKVDDLGRAMAFTKDVARSILIEAAAAPEAERECLMAFARRSESANRRTAMLNLVTSEDGIPISHLSLDVDPMLLNVINGTIELRTGRIRGHRQEDLLTCLAPVKYDAAADAPIFRQFLERVQPLEEMRAFLQRAVGMTLSGQVFDQVLLFLYGLGANGKTVFLRLMQALLGLDYAHQAPTELLVAKQNRGHPTELASLFRKRLVVCTEIGSGLRLNEQLVKQLTGGDLITARRMKEDFWTFPPTHKLWIAGNHKPVIRGTDEGMWRRILLVLFSVTIPPDERDPDLFEKLTKELPGILNWAIEGCLLWQREGLNPPPAVMAATAEYREEQDTLAEFLSSECVFNEKAEVSAKDLYAAYVRWCEGAGEKPLEQRTFGVRLTERGLGKKKISIVVYLGIGLKSDATS
jgi:putative DNA primase/helicase